MNLRPFKVEETIVGLTNQSCLNSVPKSDKITIIPMETDSPLLAQTVDNDHHRLLNNIICTSPYEHALNKRNYIEVEETVEIKLSMDWDMYPQAKYYAAQCLAGSVILNQSTKTAVICNTVEIYGRTITNDVHRERFGVEKDGPLKTSLPSGTGPYEKIKIMKKGDTDRSKLIIGTHTQNALVTYSLRIDMKLPACIGARVQSFEINNSDNLKLFVDQAAVYKADKLLASQQNCLEQFSLSYQLRQLKSKFDKKSTYYMLRCTNPSINNHTLYPYTTFTLCDYDSNQDSDAKQISGFFKMIAVEAITKQNPAIEKAKVTELLTRVQTEPVRNLLKEINNLFSMDECSAINLYQNKKLNKILQELAKSLSSSISTANKTIAKAIANEFSR